MPAKKGVPAPRPALKPKPKEDDQEKARVEKDEQEKLNKMKELYESGSGLIDIAKIYKIPPR